MTIKHLVFLGMGVAFATGALADPATDPVASGITMSGIIDAAIVHASDQKGLSNNYMRGGNMQYSSLTFHGLEDLGNGSSALFTLETGFDPTTGQQQVAGSLFNRQAFVGLANVNYGTVTVGRQYTPYFLFTQELAMTNGLSGTMAAHPGDYDGLDFDVRGNNSVVYTSPMKNGLQGSMMVASGEEAGNTTGGSTLSAALRFNDGRWHSALAFTKLKNGTVHGAWDPSASASFFSSPVNVGYLSSASIQHAVVATRYTEGKWELAGNLTNSVFRPGAYSLFKDNAVFGTAQLMAIYHVTDPLSFSAGYSYTKTHQANGIENPVNYRQVAFQQRYRLSKQTSLYLMENYQVARGQTLSATGSVVNAVAVVGDSQNATPSSGRTAHVLMAGINMHF